MTVSDRTHRDYTPAPEPPDELERLKALHDLAILDTDPEEAYDDLAALASFICGVPIALVSLLDRDRQWFKAHHGLDATETPRDFAFCGYTILQDEMFIVPDATKDLVLRRSLETVTAFALQEKVDVRVATTPEHVRADEYRLAQVVVNLLSNAIKFSPPGSIVDVTAEARGDDVEVRVIDHGRGVPASARGDLRAFSPGRCFRFEGQGGAGLGLAISKAIVEQHGGTIGVDSEEGRGSTFWFRVPRVIHDDEGSAG